MKTRIISAVVALAIVIPLLIIGGIPWAIGVGAIALLGYVEVVNLKTSHNKLPNIVKITGAIALMLLTYMTFDGYSFAFGLSYKAVAIAFLLIFVPSIFMDSKYSTKDAFYLFGFVTLLGLVFNSFIVLRTYDIYTLIYLILITTMTDTFALVFGKLLGKHKLIPKVSPKKTWEGSIFGSLVGTFIAVIFFINLVGTLKLLPLIGITFLLSVVGQIGDLAFSKIKRENNIKDFSNIMPGHGGILDRLDSLSFVILGYIILFTVL